MIEFSSVIQLKFSCKFYCEIQYLIIIITTSIIKKRDLIYNDDKVKFINK